MTAAQPPCRFCGAPLSVTFVDLGMSPLSESFLSREELRHMEPFYPLHVFACERCFLVQVEAFVSRENIFTEYAYFSAYSSSWVDHARSYVEMICRRLQLGPDSLVVELASNDGYLLQHFIGTDIPILGIEPAANVARAAEERGVPTLVEFFGRHMAERLVQQGKLASLIIANNVLAQVPDLNDFVAGIALLLAPEGTVTLEFPHLFRLVEGMEYDTIYHEHFSYFSLTSVVRILSAHGLEVVDVEELPTHGGSLRVYARHAGSGAPARAVASILDMETRNGLHSPGRYARFAEDVKESKRSLLELLIRLRREGKQVVGYGAPGKATTLLNYCGIRTDLIDYTVDRNPYKHGRFTPGTRIPIYPPERISETRPEFVVILPWNLVDEISSQLAYISEWGASFIVPVPRATIRLAG